MMFYKRLYLVTHAGGSITLGPNDFRLDLTHYDFSIGHSDFSGLSEAVYTQPDYVDTPFGAWLATSATPTSDSFSEWYRYVSGVNAQLYNAIVMEHQPSEPVPTHRWVSLVGYICHNACREWNFEKV